MKKHQRELEELIKDCGLTIRGLVQSGTHYKYTVIAEDGSKMTLVASKTPSCHRAALNNRSILRRFAAEHALQTA